MKKTEKSPINYDCSTLGATSTLDVTTAEYYANERSEPIRPKAIERILRCSHFGRCGIRSYRQCEFAQLVEQKLIKLV
jgi:hypothetical protein